MTSDPTIVASSANHPNETRASLQPFTILLLHDALHVEVSVVGGEGGGKDCLMRVNDGVSKY